MKIIDENVKKWKFSDIRRIFTEKSASRAENCDLWKITKNVTTHHQMVRFGSFLDMLVLATSRKDFCVKILLFLFFSEKSQISSKNRQKSPFFCWKFAIFRWKMKISKFWHRNLFYWLQGPAYIKMSQIGLSGDELLRFSWFFTNRDFQHRMLIFQWKSTIFHYDPVSEP